MSLASLTVDLSLGLARFESDSGKAAQIVSRDAEKMARATEKADAAVRRLVQSYGQVGVESKIISSAAAGASDSALKLFAGIDAGVAAFARVGSQGSAAFKAIGASSESALQNAQARILQLADKVRQVKDQAATLTKSAVSQRESGGLDDDGLKKRLADIRAVQAAELERISATFRADSDARRAAQAERASSSTGAISAIGGASTAQASAQAQVYAAFLNVQAVAAQNAAQAQARLNEVTAAVSAASDRARASQQAAYETKIAYIASVNEEAAALFRTKDAQRALDAERAGVSPEQAAQLAKLAGDREFIASIYQKIDAEKKVAAEFGKTTTEILRQDAAERGLVNTTSSVIQRFEALAASNVKLKGDGKFLADIDAQIEALRKRNAELGKTPAQNLRNEAAARGQTDDASGKIAALEQLTAAYDAQKAAIKRVADGAKFLVDVRADLQEREKQEYAATQAYISSLNEEAAALGRTTEQQRKYAAVKAGVSPEKAAQLAKNFGDQELLADLDKQILAEQRKLDAAKSTTAELLRQKVAERSLNDDGTKQKISNLEALAKANIDAANAATKRKTAESFSAEVNQRANAIGVNGDGKLGLKLQSDLLAERAAVLGLTKELDPAIQKIRQFEEATGQAGKKAFGTRNQLLTLKYTLSDVISSAASGISPLTILLQQAPQVAQIQGGIGGVFRTAIELITPFRLGMAGAAAAVGVLAFAMFEGKSQSKAFADSLVLTGGFAGVTEGQFNALARGIAASGQVTVGAARESAQALISTGQIGPQVFAKATQAAALYGKATGQNAAEVAKDFASMSDDAAKWAADHNKSLNFITSAQYDQIKSLQELGKTAEAQGIVYEAIADRFKHVDDNLGYLGTTLKVAKGLWSDFWNSAYDVGRTETIEGKITKLQVKLQSLQPQALDKQNPFAPSPGSRSAQLLEDKNAPQRQAIQGEISALQSDQGLIQQATAEKARRAELAKLNIAFDATAQAYRFAAKAGSEKKKARAELDAFFDRRLEEGNPVNPQDKADSIKGLNKKFTDQGAANKGISEADAQRKSNLAKALQGFAADLAKETDVLKFHQSELQAIYSAGSISLAKFNDDKAKTTAEGVQAEINAQNKATARLNAELAAGKFKDPHERTDVEKQRNESIAKSANLVRDAQHAAALAVYADAASVKALAKEVEAFNANLLQAKGDDFGAAQVRNAQALKDALEFARKATPLQSTGDFAREERRQEAGTSLKQRAEEQGQLNDAAAEFAKIQTRVGIATADAARAEELYLLRSKQGGASLIEQDQAIYTIRATALVQLGELADKAKALAEESRKPEVIAAAKDLALAYAKAAEAVDPAIDRIRAALDGLSQSVSQLAVSSISGFTDSYTARFQNAEKEVSQQRKDLDTQLSQLQHYLANSNDAKEKALLQDQIRQVKAKKASLEVSKTEQQIKTIERDILGPILKQIRDASIKEFITEPFQKGLKGTLRKFLDGNSGIADALRTGIGASAGKFKGTSNDPSARNFENESDKASSAAEAAKALAAKQDPLLTQTVAVKASTDALASLTAAANGAATALGGKPAAGSTQVAQIDASGLFGKYAGTSNDPSAANYQNESDKGGAAAASEKLGSSLALTKSNADQFSAALPIASSFLQSLGGEASIAGRALSLLPTIISLIQSASSGSSLGGLAGLFKGGSGGVGSSASYAARDFIAAANGHAFGSAGLQAFAKGDIFNSPTAFRFARGSGFANGVMGEAGPEAVMPLRRGADGKLGVSVGGQATVQRQPMGAMSGGNIYVTNNAPAEVKEAKRDDRGDWHLLIEAAADQAHSRVAADIGGGSGRVATAMKGRGVNLGGNLPKRG